MKQCVRGEISKLTFIVIAGGGEHEIPNFLEKSRQKNKM